MTFFSENAFMISYVVVVVLSIIQYSKYYDTPLKYLPVLFFYTLLTELLGGIILEYEEWRLFGDELLHYYNTVIYNIYTIIFFLYFYYVFRLYVVRQVFKRLIAWGAVLFLVASLLNPFIQSFLFESQTYAYVVGTLVLLGSILFYWFDRRRAESQIHWKHNLLLWLSVGLFLFYAAYLPIEIYRYSNVLTGGREPAYIRVIVRFLIIFMNLIFCTGLLLMSNKPLRIKR